MQTNTVGQQKNNIPEAFQDIHSETNQKLLENVINRPQDFAVFRGLVISHT